MIKSIVETALAVDMPKIENIVGTDPANADLSIIGQAIDYLRNTGLAFAGIVAAIMVFYGAFQYVTSYGDDAKAKTAKSTITWALIGLIVIGLSAILVNLTKQNFN